MNPSARPAPVHVPLPLQVRTDGQGYPVMVQLKSRQWPVQAVHDQWVQPPAPPEPSRSFYLLRLDGGRLCCVFHCAAPGQWDRPRSSQQRGAPRTLPPRGEH